MTEPRLLRKPSAAWPLVLLAVVFATVATGLTVYFQTRPTPLPVLFDAPPFELTNQLGQSVSSTRELRGKVWIANFVFTNCAGPCPRMTATLAKVLDTVKSGRVGAASISVDPTRDTPAVLLEYAAKFDADNTRWFFLTSPGTDYMQVAAAFKVAAGAAQGEHPIFHSEKFFLVDAAGRVRGIYSHNDDVEMARLVTDIGRLLGE